jgi:hypothetical protein
MDGRDTDLQIYVVCKILTINTLLHMHQTLVKKKNSPPISIKEHKDCHD